MDMTKLQGADIKTYKNVKGPSKCNGMCRDEAECSFWTYTSGRCFLKNNDVFTHKNLPSGFSGEQNCNSSGNNL